MLRLTLEKSFKLASSVHVTLPERFTKPLSLKRFGSSYASQNIQVTMMLMMLMQSLGVRSQVIFQVPATSALIVMPKGSFHPPGYGFLICSLTIPRYIYPLAPNCNLFIEILLLEIVLII